MITTKTSHRYAWNYFQLAFVALLLGLGLTACGDKEEVVPSEPEPTPLTPTTPISEEDYITVPSAGGTITRGELQVTFPEGTFSGDTKIAVTKVKKGEILGEDEVSDFYQLMMPVSNRKPITVRIPSTEVANDIFVVANLPSISKHLLDIVEYCPVSYETTYTGGEYVATLPAANNSDAKDEVAISVGLGHRAVFSRSADIGGTRATRAIDGETEGQISWYFETDRKFEADNAIQLATTVDRINGYIHAALKQIDKLGFKLTKATRRIPITLFKKNKNTAELWGEFKQHYSDDTKSWFSIREDMLTNPYADQQDVKATIFHELLHYFQADYDQRMPYLKFRSCNGDELLMYEAGGQWIEKFVYGHLPDKGDNINRYKHFVKGLNDLNAIYAGLDLAKSDILGVFDIGKARQSHGYAMSLLWEYLAYELGDKAIAEIYDEWARKAVTYGWENETTFKTLQSFASTKNSYLFSGGYESFLLQSAQGGIAPGFSIISFDAEQTQLTAETKAFEFKGVNYAYGADTKDIFVRWRSAESLTNKELVIKLLTDDMNTYVFGSGKTLRRETPYTSAEELVIPGSELESMRDGGIIISHYLLLTTHYPSSVNPKPKDYTISVELRDADVSVSPSELNFDADGGTQSFTINYGSYGCYGANLRAEGKGWCGVKAVGQEGEIQVTVLPNTTAQPRECIIDAYVCPDGSSPESEYIKMPVRVKQEAGEDDGGSYHIEAYLTGKISADFVTTYQDGRVTSGVTDFDIDFNAETDMEYAGGPLHVQVSDDDATPETLSFNVTGLTGDYTGSSAQSIKYTKETGISFATGYVKNTNNYTSMTIEIGSLPVDAGSIYKGDYGGTLWFTSENGGLQSMSFKFHSEEDTTEGMFGPVNGHRSIDCTYHPDGENHLMLKCTFWRNASSAAPQHRSQLNAMPWNSDNATAKLPSHADVKVR